MQAASCAGGTWAGCEADGSVQQRVGREGDVEEASAALSDASLEPRIDRELCDAIEQGFQLATQSGPLCAEPMQGLAFFVEQVAVNEDALRETRGRLSQQASSLISSVRE